MICRRPFAFVVFASALVAGQGCATSKEVKAKTHSSVVLEADKKRTQVTLQIADEVKMQLPPVSQAGYRWQVFSHDSRFLRQTSEVTAPDASGNSFVTFIGLNPTPRTLVRFLLIKQSESKETKPVDSHDVVVAVQ